MSNGTNIVFKKNDGTTDATLTFVSPQQSDSSPSVFRNQAVGTALSHQPEARIGVKTKSGMKEVRITGKIPETALNSTTGLTAIVGKGAGFVLTFWADDNMANASVNEAVAMLSGVASSVLARDVMKTRTSVV